MCLAIYSYYQEVPEKHLHNGHTSNKDGCGFAYRGDHTENWHIVRGLWTWSKFQKIKERHIGDGASFEVVYHFRLATHGLVNVGNAQPLPIGGYGILAHNGIMRLSHATQSDTRVFANTIAKPLAAGGLFDTLYNVLTYVADQSSSRFVLALNGDATRLYGDWKNDAGIWYSNNGYKGVATSTHVYTVGGYDTDWRHTYMDQCEWCSQWVWRRVPVKLGDNANAGVLYVCRECAAHVRKKMQEFADAGTLGKQEKCELCGQYDALILAIVPSELGIDGSERAAYYVCRDCADFYSSLLEEQEQC